MTSYLPGTPTDGGYAVCAMLGHPAHPLLERSTCWCGACPRPPAASAGT